MHEDVDRVLAFQRAYDEAGRRLFPGDETVVRAWAVAHGIDPAWVKAKRVTFNFEAGALAKLSPGSPDLPRVLRRRGEAITPLSPGDL